MLVKYINNGSEFNMHASLHVIVCAALTVKVEKKPTTQIEQDTVKNADSTFT